MALNSSSATENIVKKNLHRILPHKSPSVKSHGTAQSPSRSAIQIPNFGVFHTKTESKDDFDIHNCAFEVAFDESTQLRIYGLFQALK